MTDTGWIAGALVLGFAIGALVVWLINRKAAGPNHSVKALREESERFREQVNDHFVETAELINQLTDSYKKVFDHLSDGAERLVDEKVIRERMPEVSDQEIRLKRIGQTSSRASQPADKKASSAAASSDAGNARGPAASAGASDSGRKVPEAPVTAVGERKTPGATPDAREKTGDSTSAQTKSPSSGAGQDGQSASAGKGEDASSDDQESVKQESDKQESDQQKAAAEQKDGSPTGQPNESDSTKRGTGSSSS